MNAVTRSALPRLLVCLAALLCFLGLAEAAGAVTAGDSTASVRPGVAQESTLPDRAAAFGHGAHESPLTLAADVASAASAAPIGSVAPSDNVDGNQGALAPVADERPVQGAAEGPHGQHGDGTSVHTMACMATTAFAALAAVLPAVSLHAAEALVAGPVTFWPSTAAVQPRAPDRTALCIQRV